MKRKYQIPMVSLINLRTESMLALSYTEIPIEPDTPGTPAAREEHPHHGNNVWNKEW